MSFLSGDNSGLQANCKIKTHPVTGWVLSEFRNYRFSQTHTRMVQLRQQQHRHMQVAERAFILKPA
jgi:hypothetical protein